MERSTIADEAKVPRALDIMRLAAAREPEITALIDTLKIQGRFGATVIPRVLRRRARSHNPYRRLRRPNTKLAEVRKQTQNDRRSADVDTNEVIAAPGNRKMRRRGGKLQAQFALSAQWNETNLMPEANNKRRLETHRWHVKRLSTVERWGWILPEGELGRGHGSRAFIKRLKQGAVVHDASYWCPILLIGNKEELVLSFATLLDGKDESEFEKLLSSKVTREKTFIIHQPGQFPGGVIGPTFISPIPNCDDSAQQEGGMSLLVWVHAAAVNDAYSAISAAIQGSMCENITMRVTDIRRIEVRGGFSENIVLQALFNSAALPPGVSYAANIDLETQNAVEAASNIEHLKAMEIAPYIIADPRVARPQIVGSTAASLLHNTTPPTSLNILANDLSPPASDARISQWRNTLRRDFLGITDAVITPKLDSIPLRENADRALGLFCPILYVKRPWGQNVPGCTLIVPAGWVVPIWHALIFAKCKAIGQREWRWLHTLLGKPCYPYDMPDTTAYGQLTLESQQQQQHEYNKRPKGRRTELSMAPLLNQNQERESVASQGSELVVLRSLKAISAIPQQESGGYYVEVLVSPRKTGHIALHCSLCHITGLDAKQTLQKLYVVRGGKITTNPEDDDEAIVGSTKDVVQFGYATSEALQGSRRGTASFGICSLAAVRQLEEAQNKLSDNGSKQRKASIIAFAQNPNSNALFPVQIRLC